MNIFEAIKSGDLEDVKTDIENMKKTGSLDELNKEKTKDGDMAIHAAVREGDVEIVDYLLKCGANPWLQNAAGETALHIIAADKEEDKTEILTCILDRYEDNGLAEILGLKNTAGETVLHIIAAEKEVDKTEILTRILDWNDDNNLTEILDLLNNDGKTVLYLASEIGDSEVVKIFLDNGANPNTKNAQNQIALHIAASIPNNNETIELLLEAKSDVSALDEFESTPLHFATSISDNDEEIIQNLLGEKNANVAKKDQYGNTPLHLAADDKMAEILLKNGAGANDKNDDGQTPLFCVVEGGETPCISNNKKIAKVNLKYGADINLEANNGYTPLYGAIHDEKPEMIKFLIENGADINKKTDGNTPLHAALQCEEDGFECLEILLENGADLSIPNKEGKTPRFLIENSNNAELLEILEKHDQCIAAGKNLLEVVITNKNNLKDSKPDVTNKFEALGIVLKNFHHINIADERKRKAENKKDTPKKKQRTI